MSKYVIRITSRTDPDKRGYYSAKTRWETVMKCAADRMSHKEARLICNKFGNPRIGYSARMIEVDK